MSSKFDIEHGASFIVALANAKRLHILDILSQGEMSVGGLAELVGLSQSALSQHLSKLRAEKLVSTRRDAQTVYYSCESEPVARVLSLLAEFFQDDELQIRQVA